MAQEKPGETVREAAAVFDDPGKLEAAVSDLQSHGFDRADISVLAREGLTGRLAQDYPDTKQAASDPDAKRDALISDTDVRQARVLGTSLAAALAAFAAAGITVMTGGTAALAAGAAAAAAGGIGAAGAAVGERARTDELAYYREQIERGGVVLWVRIRDAEHERRAVDILSRNGGRDVRVHDMPVEGR